MKKNKKPILSICIPTWNRWYSLEHTLKSIIDQDEFISWDIEIVISDNASTDETEIEIWKLCKKYKNIKYFRNKENIGWVTNINKVISYWQWEYLWRCWSDTLILEGWLKKTLEIIKEKSPSIIYHFPASTEKFKQLKTNYNKNLWIYYFENLKEYFLFLWDQYAYDKASFMFIEHLLTFLSSICISRQTYEDSLNKILLNYWEERFNNYAFSQELICIYNGTTSWIWVVNKWFIDRFVGKKTGYFVSRKIVHDFKELSNFILKKYRIDNKNFSKLIKHSLFFWYKNFIYWFIVKFLIKCNLYSSFVSIYRKLNNIKNDNYIINIDKTLNR